MLMHMKKRGKMEKTYNMISKHRNIVYAFGILSVLYFHFLCIRKEAGISLDVFDRFFDLYVSSIGVEMFVFLSGMGMYFSMKKSTLKDFWKKRAVRILIPYLLVAFIVWGYVDIVKARDIGLFFKDLFWIRYLQSGVNTFWYVLFILIMYLIYPLIYKLLNTRHPLMYTGLLLICVILLNMMLSEIGGSFWKYTSIAFGRIPVYILGSYMGLLIYEKRKINIPVIGIYVLLAVMLKIYSVTHLHLEAPWNRYLSGVYGIALCFILILLAEYVLCFNWLEKIWDFIEPYTFELYLWNVGLWAMLPLFGINLASRKGYLVLFIIDIVLSYMVHKIYCLARKKIGDKNG